MNDINVYVHQQALQLGLIDEQISVSQDILQRIVILSPDLQLRLRKKEMLTQFLNQCDLVFNETELDYCKQKIKQSISINRSVTQQSIEYCYYFVLQQQPILNKIQFLKAFQLIKRQFREMLLQKAHEPLIYAGPDLDKIRSAVLEESKERQEVYDELTSLM